MNRLVHRKPGESTGRIRISTSRIQAWSSTSTAAWCVSVPNIRCGPQLLPAAGDEAVIKSIAAFLLSAIAVGVRAVASRLGAIGRHSANEPLRSWNEGATRPRSWTS